MEKSDFKIHKLASKAEHPKTPESPEEQPSVRYVAVPSHATDFTSPYPEEDSIDLLALWRVVASYRKVLLAIFLLGVLLSSSYAFLSKPIYRAELIMAAAVEEEAGGLSSLAGQFGGLASLAGVNLKSRGNDIDRVLATLKSRAFLVPFLREEIKKKKDASLFGLGPDNSAPSTQDIYKRFSEDVLDIGKNNKTGLVTLGIEWPDPVIAADWANALVARLNEHLRQAAIKEAQESIDYLNQQLEKTSVVDMQQSIYRLIESQTKVIMLANVKKEYVMQVIDPALVPEDRIRPQRSLILVLGAMFSLFVGIFTVFLLRGVHILRQQLAQSV